MDDLLVAIGLAIAIEGVLYAAFPNAMRKVLFSVLGQPDTTLRNAGLIAAALGVAIIWWVRG